MKSLLNWMRESLTYRVALVAVLTLILLIPLELVKGIISEREDRSASAINEVSYKWGDAQTFAGPMLVIPAHTPGSSHQNGNLQVLPLELNYDVNVSTETKKRGIYEVPVYRSTIDFTGTIAVEDIENQLPKQYEYDYANARVILHISDVKGLASNAQLNIDNKTYKLSSVRSTSAIPGINLSSPISLDSLTKPIRFSGSIELNGTSRLHLLPLGSTTQATIHSDWPHPHFEGAFVTSEEPQISSEGSTGKWRVLEINREYPQVFMNTDYSLMSSDFGVEFMQPVDHYAMSFRAAKYGILIISLTFVVFLLIQLVIKLRVHSVQYIMVGIGLVVFYLLLVSFAEQIGFTLAYIIAALMTTALISWYAKGIYKKRGPVTALAGTLAVTYGFIFVVMQLEDLALIAGSIILFVALAVLMYFTRQLQESESEQAS